MKRSASLDFLRGSAAFAVAIPHYLTTNAPFEPAVETVAIVGVEVFFVLSGFVLAPQIVDWVIARPWRNLRVFLARRWMRTIPPYVAALAVVALMTGNLMTADTLRYLFYVENLVGSANATDYYPVAWSLAVEEWFYLLFAPIMFLIGRLLGRSDRRFEVAFALLFILLVAALRTLAAPHHWDLDVRRATVFRVDSIAWGYLLYLAMEKRPLLALKTAAGQGTFAALAAALGLATALEFGVALGALGGNAVAQQAFPYASALFGVSAVGLLSRGGSAFQGTRRQRRQLLARPHFLFRLSLSHRHRDGAEAEDRGLAAPRAARALRRPPLRLLDSLLARLRAADPRRAAELCAAGPHPALRATFSRKREKGFAPSPACGRGPG